MSEPQTRSVKPGPLDWNETAIIGALTPRRRDIWSILRGRYAPMLTILTTEAPDEVEQLMERRFALGFPSDSEKGGDDGLGSGQLDYRSYLVGYPGFGH